jgi:hypothetical protein
MTAEDKAKELLAKFNYIHNKELKKYIIYQSLEESKRCALIAVQQILNSNPHSNPFNTEIHSTYPYWEKVKLEIEKL